MNQEIKNILRSNPNGVFITTAGGRIKARVFQYLFAEDNKVFFCTSSEKNVYQQITANPQVAFCTYASDFSPVVTLSGKAHFVEDTAVKARVLDENPMIKAIYQSADNPVFKVFYLRVEEIDTFSFTEGGKNIRL